MDRSSLGGTVAAWTLAVGVTAAPIVAAMLGGGGVEAWIPIYVAGAFGGLVFELLGARWELELPRSAAAAPADGDGGVSAFGAGPRYDLGFLGRLFTGGLGGVVAVMLVAAALAGDEGAATAVAATPGIDLSLGWGLAAGAATRAVWSAVTGLVTGRLAAAGQVIEDAHAAVIAARQERAAATQSDAATISAGATPSAAAGAIGDRTDGALAVLEVQLERHRRALVRTT